MCGIFGVVMADGTAVPDPRRLKESARLIEHRGPDSAGIHAEEGIGLAHTRLSLVDLSERSRQPFWDEERRFCLVFNGEIYNFRELRAEMETRGATFRTTGDTEVLLQSLVMDGPDVTLPKLEGMFAFALFDRHQRTLAIARDRFGIKPLSLYVDDRQVLFSSEIKALRPWVNLAPDAFMISSYLLGFGGPTKDATFYRGVRIVPPGALVRLSIGGSPSFSRFASMTNMLDGARAEELTRMNGRQVVDHLDELLQRAVKQMMFADAPVGALCSGGVDSSVVMAIAAQHHTNLAIFHANVVGPQSEHEAALHLSEHLGLDLKSVDVTDQDFIDLIPEVLEHYEHPFTYHPNSVPFLMVARLVKAHGVKGVLSGEGADECFLGYPQLAREPFEQFCARRVRQLERLVRSIPKIGRLLWPWEARPSMLAMGMLNRFERELEEEHNRSASDTFWDTSSKRNVRTLDLLSYHLRTLLHRNDCLGMAASIEARFPFLDERLVGMAINLPYKNKIRFSPLTWELGHPFLRDKWVLRRVADRYLPRKLSRRKKMGFWVTAFDRISVDRAYFDGSFVADYFELAGPQIDYLSQNADQTLRVKLLLVDVWGCLFMRNARGPEMAERLREHVSVAPGPH